jgi:hypothetical protein
MKRSIYILIVVSLLSLLLTSCNSPNEIVQKTPEDADMLAVQITLEPTLTIVPTAKPTASCPDINSFGRLDEYWPGLFTFPSTWKFTWFYASGTTKASPFDWNWTCVPESYSIYLSTGPDFEDEIEVPIGTPHVTYDVSKVTLDWIFNYPLEPLKVYRWVAVGHYGDIDIGMDRVAELHQDAKWIGQYPINKGSFRTGPQSVFAFLPICESGSIDVPELLIPADHETINILKPTYFWDVPSCMPLVFYIQLSRNPNLDLALGHTSYDDEDYTFRLQLSYPWLDMQKPPYGIMPALPDCTTYYWRVRGGIGDVTNDPREWGEWSGIQSFFVNSGTCPTATPTPTRVPPTKTPTPTATPTQVPVPVDCSNYHDEASCVSHSSCVWEDSGGDSGPKCIKN